MLNDSILPDMPSAEFDAIYNLVSRAVRAARHHNPATSFNEITQQPPVQLMFDFIEQQVNGVFDHPPIHVDESAMIHYIDKARWTLDEAISLAAGIDPVYYALNAAPLSDNWRTIRSFIELRTHHAIVARRLACIVQDNECYVVPHDFCQFALNAGLADKSVIDFFKDI